MIRRVIVAGLVTVSLAAVPVSAQESGSAEAEIRAQFAGWLAAWENHDADAVASYYDDDADWTHAHGLTRHGRDAIHKRYTEVFSMSLPDGVEQTLSLEIIAVRMITDDVAIVDAQYEFSGLKAAPTLVGTGRTAVVMVKRDGTWLRSAQRNFIPITPECLELCGEKHE